ncbi:MAG: DUF1614 domain-containing protein [Nitrospira sp.]|nr:DUF1614 domain-containing protein [Nitrospira sp.]
MNTRGMWPLLFFLVLLGLLPFVFGPLIGADLLHLRDIEKIATGIASIGGAGFFEGIVLSAIVAAYLA